MTIEEKIAEEEKVAKSILHGEFIFEEHKLNLFFNALSNEIKQTEQMMSLASDQATTEQHQTMRDIVAARKGVKNHQLEGFNREFQLRELELKNVLKQKEKTQNPERLRSIIKHCKEFIAILKDELNHIDSLLLALSKKDMKKTSSEWEAVITLCRNEAIIIAKLKALY